jgi:hypothetical protein
MRWKRREFVAGMEWLSSFRYFGVLRIPGRKDEKSSHKSALWVAASAATFRSLKNKGFSARIIIDF